MLKHFCLCAALLLTLTVGAAAQIVAVTPQINFQGRLAKPDGTPLPDANAQAVTFRLYRASAGGTALWSQNSSLAVRNGAFAAPLDFSAGYASGQSLSTLFAPLSLLYLEIQVGTNTPLAPRQLVASNAYAFLANTAASVIDGSITTAKLAPGVLNFSNISGQITGSQIAPNTITNSNLNASLQTSLNHFTNGLTLVSNVPVLPGSSALALAPSYIFTANYNTMQIFSINGASAGTPALVGSIAADNPDAIAVSGNYVYLGCVGVNKLETINVSNPAAPALSAQTPTGNGPAGIAIAKGYAYVVNVSDNTLQAFSLSNPAAPVFSSTVATYVSPPGPFYPGGGDPVSIAASGNYLYVINSLGNTLQVFSIASPASPASVAVIATGHEPVSVAVSGSYAYVTNKQDTTLQTFDITNPAAPVSRGAVACASSPEKVVVSGGNAFVIGSNGSNLLQVFSLANPAVPALTAAIRTGFYPQGLGVNGSLIYEVNGIGNTLQTFDLNGLLLNTGFQTAGSLSTTGDVIVDANGQNSGGFAPALRFGGNGSSEGIASQRSGTANLDGLDFYTNGVIGMSLTNNSSLGVGTLNPQAKLDVVGDIKSSGKVSATGAISGASLNVTGGIVAGSLSATGLVSGGSVSASGAISGGSLAAAGTLTAGGAAQAASVTSLGGVNVDKNNVGDGATAKGISFGIASGEGIVSRRTAAPNQYGVDITTSFTPRISVTNGGNVGVNTQTPIVSLDVNGSTAVRGDFKMIQRGGGAGNNSGQGRALVDAGLNQGGVGATGLHINYANDFGQVNIDSDTYVSGKVYSNGVALTSDARYKMNIVTLDHALENLLNLRGVTYDYDRAKWPAKNFPAERQIGFIAQEVERIFPELVVTDANGYKSVMYQNAVPILVEGMKAQQKQIEAQKREIETLKTDNVELRKQSARITELEKNLADVLTALRTRQKAPDTDPVRK